MAALPALDNSEARDLFTRLYRALQGSVIRKCRSLPNATSVDHVGAGTHVATLYIQSIQLPIDEDYVMEHT
jgi:hypothetical protein